MCQEEGGYYAIKGFLFQYDKSILELLSNNENTQIYVERLQDIDYENYVLQVKHKETANFSNSKIREPMIKLLDLFITDDSRKFCLYGYFKNQQPHQVTYSTVSELKKVLKYRDSKKNKELYARFSDELLGKFIKNFVLCFSEDYDKQFSTVLEDISKKFEVSVEEACLYHAIIRNILFKVVLNENPEKRCITFRRLKEKVEECRNITFEAKYQEIVGRQKFLKVLNKKYFTFNAPNINNFERLFLIDCHNIESKTVARQIIDKISRRYYKKGKSPAPYICFRNLNRDIQDEIKQGLLDDHQNFSDGTFFDGDRFRKEELKNATNVTVKFLYEEYILDFGVEFKEVYEFFLKEKSTICEESYKIKIQIDSIEEIKELIS